MDSVKKKIVEDIQKFGWHVVSVACDNPKDHFCYTIGLYKSFGFPELVMKGLPLETMHRLINDVIKNKPDFSDINRQPLIVSNLLRNNLNLCVHKIDLESIQEHIFYCCDYNLPNLFDVCQVYWPDSNNRLPTDEQCDAKIKKAQMWDFNEN